MEKPLKNNSFMENNLSQENELTLSTEVIELAENGLGFGEGSINVADRLRAQDDGLNQNILDKVGEAIRSKMALTPVGKDDDGEPIKDDGCPDGRGVRSIFDKFKEYSRSLARPKVFGGGPVMAFSALIGLGKSEETLTETFQSGLDLLDANGLEYGAHCDEGMDDTKSGCGAMDKAEDIIRSISSHSEDIAKTTYSLLRTLGEESDDLGQDIDSVMSNFHQADHKCDGNSKGANWLSKIKDKGKVIKQLLGKHKEVRIVFNTVDSHTVDQEYIRTVSEGKAQVFAIDAWRMQEIAEGLFPRDEQAQKKSLISMVVYSLGVSATLTKGDLPVDLIK